MRLRHVVWVSGAVALALFIAMAIGLAPVRPTILALQLTFTRADFATVAQSWSPDERLRVLGHFGYDCAFMVAYAIFGAAWARHTRYSPTAPRWLAPTMPWLLPAAAVLDAIEDALQFPALYQPEVVRLEAWFALAGSAAAGKFGLAIAFVALHWRYRVARRG